MKLLPRQFNIDRTTTYGYALFINHPIDFYVALELAPYCERYIDIKIVIGEEIYEVSGERFVEIIRDNIALLAEGKDIDEI